MKKSFTLMTCMPCILWAAMADQLQVEGAYIRANPPARATTAAYMQLQNTGEAPVLITSIQTPIAGEVQIHTTVMDNHVMHMEHVEVLEIPAQSTVNLTPGGLHMMLTSVVEGVIPGTKTKMTFHFEDGSTSTTMVPVRSIREGIGAD